MIKSLFKFQLNGISFNDNQLHDHKELDNKVTFYLQLLNGISFNDNQPHDRIELDSKVYDWKQT